jgi:hypothetical protein
MRMRRTPGSLDTNQGIGVDNWGFSPIIEIIPADRWQVKKAAAMA